MTPPTPPSAPKRRSPARPPAAKLRPPIPEDLTEVLKNIPGVLKEPIVLPSACQDPIGPYGIAVAIDPDRGAIPPLFWSDDLGMGTSLYYFSPPPFHTLSRQEAHVGQGLFDAVHHNSQRSRVAVSAGAIEDLFYRGMEAIREKGFVHAPRAALPWNGQHPSCKHPRVSPTWFKTLGNRLGTLGRGNQWIALFKILDKTEASNFEGGGYILAVQAGARGAAAFENLPDVPVSLSSAESEPLWEALGRIQTFALANRLALASQALAYLEKTLEIPGTFLLDTPTHAIEHLSLPWRREAAESLVLMRRGAAITPTLVRGPLGESSYILAPTKLGTVLPVDGGFLAKDAEGPAAQAPGPRWLFGSDEKTTRLEAPGRRKPIERMVETLVASGQATFTARLEPRMLVLA